MGSIRATRSIRSSPSWTLQRQARRRQRQASGRRSEGQGGLVNALRDYTSIRTRGCTPPSSTSWKDPDNNVAFHNKTIRDDAQRDDLDRREVARRCRTTRRSRRSSARRRRRTTTRTSHRGLPEQARRSKSVYRARGEGGRDLRRAKNKRRAKEFVTFIMQDENLHAVCRGFARPLVPGHQLATKSAFWQADPHRKCVFNQFGAGTVTFEFTKNYKFTSSTTRTSGQGDEPRRQRQRPVEKAVDEMIARIKQSRVGRNDAR
jgi:multiple sugar transport system substrate-binding protein